MANGQGLKKAIYHSYDTIKEKVESMPDEAKSWLLLLGVGGTLLAGVPYLAPVPMAVAFMHTGKNKDIDKLGQQYKNKKSILSYR